MCPQRKIKVFHIIWKLVVGGAETVAMNLLREFENDGEFEFRLATTYPFSGQPYEQEVLQKKYPVVSPRNYDFLPRPLARAFSTLTRKYCINRWLSRQIQLYKPDIIHVHLANSAVKVYEILNNIPDVPIVYHMHSMPEDIKPDWRDIIKTAFERKRYVPLCVSEFQRESARKFYGIDKNAFVLRNGVDVDKYVNYRQTDVERSELRAKLGIAQDAFLLGCVSRDAAIKNNELLVEALKTLVRLKPSTRLLFVGQFSEEYKRNLLELESLNGYGESRIVWAGLRNDLFKVYRIFDVFALASFYESSSIVSLEAQLSGVPCVLSNRIPREVIFSDGATTVDPDASPEIWAKKIADQHNKKVNFVSDYRKFDLKESNVRLRTFYRSLFVF